MILKYGTRTRPSNEAGVSITRSAVKDAAERIWAYEETWAIEGLISRSRGATETANRAYIKAQTALVETMFGSEGLDLKLYAPDGVTLSHHYVTQAQTIGGVRIAEPLSFPKYLGTECLTVRQYRVVLKFVRPIGVAATGTSLILDFQEDCSYEGGGPHDIYLETLKGLPQRQRARYYTPYRVVQRGSAKGLYTRPTIPPPIWPAARDTWNPVVTRGAPRRVGNSLIEWPITWQYTFTSSFPLIGYPNEWGQTYGT